MLMTLVCPTTSITFGSLIANNSHWTCNRLLILVKDPNLGASTTMHNRPSVCEEKDEKGRINNSFDTKAFNLNEFFISIK
jgi:hypothetical protein